MKIGQTELRVVQDDITAQKVGAIVNAANDQLILGGGVAGAIRAKGGPSIQAECDRIGFTPVGTAAITGAGDLAADYVIHAVGPRWGEGDEEAKLAGAITSSLKLADDNEITSIAFPAVSTGIFGFPVKPAARIMLRAAGDYLKPGQTGLKEVIFCLFGPADLAVFEQALAELDA